MKKNRNWTHLQLFCIVIVLILSCIDGFSEDIEFEELPKAIQKIVIREIGDVPIDDIDREEDDGEIEYDVEAENDSIRIELEISEDGTFLQRDITEEISFAELPKPVQDTVRRHVGSLEIDDIERKSELGKDVFYDVEVDDMGIEIELEIAQDGTLIDIDVSDPIELRVELVAKSKLPTLEDISPYREALVFYEYKLKKRLDGEFKGKKLRVAHWAIYDNQPQSIGTTKIGSSMTLELYPYQQYVELESIYTSDTLELDIDVPLYHDIGQKILEDHSIDDRFDYDSILSEKMPVFWQLKDQLKLVALGDSRCECGVRTGLFYGKENQKTPVAYNLAISGGSLEVQKLVVDEYLLKLPNLEWVVYQMSPRVVNRHFEKSSERVLRRSDGFEFDQKHAETLWKPSDGSDKKKTVEEISVLHYVGAYWSERPWGWEYKNEVWQDPEKDDFDEEWEISDKRWNRLKDMIDSLKERDAQMLLYLSPFHPIMRGESVVDDDGTTQEGYRELVKRLKQLEKQFPNFVFLDLMLGGDHDFSAEMFKDLDHLNAKGATKLTQELEKVRQRSPKKRHK